MSRAATITLIVSDVALNTHAASSAERPTNKMPATTQDGRLRFGAESETTDGADA